MDALSTLLLPTHLQYILHLSLHSDDPLDIPASVTTQCKGPEEDLEEDKGMVTLWRADSTGHSSTLRLVSL